MNNAAQQPDPPKTTIAQTIGAHLDAGTIITGIIGFLIVLLINMGIGKLDKLTDGIWLLNEKMATVMTRWEFQDKKDTQQDARLERIEDMIRQR